MVHYTLTLSGAAQRLSDALPDALAGGVHDAAFALLHLQADGANAAPIYVGTTASPAVSATNYGVRLPASASGVPMAPYVFERVSVKLSHFYVIGGSGEKLHVLGVPG